MPARRASPRVHDHDDGDGLKTGSVLGVGGNILGIGLSHEDRGEIRTHTQHPGIGGLVQKYVTMLIAKARRGSCGAAKGRG